ncbi:MAG: uracil-DNA glycosylase [Paracoccaceae bacterium]
MESELDFHRARALLEWQIDLGATEAIGETPVNRYEIPATVPKPKPPAATAPADTPAPVAAPGVDPVAVARDAAASAGSLDQLQTALAGFEHCELKKGARNLVFSDGVPTARIMVIGEAPGRDEDMQGKPFVGRAGKLLDAMFGAIGHGRENAETPIYITNILPWRPPQNRDPKPDEIAMMLPFVEKHVELAAPDILVLMGNISCQAILGQKGITKLRGRWVEAMGKPVLPMFHPAYLLRNPSAKKEAWDDLLMLQAKLRET